MSVVANNQVDIVIIGGGIAGLWTLARLKQEGYQAILLEADTLGSMQTGASQGIIHGGTKYALTGKLTHSSQAIQAMPQRWKACLSGQGEVDLTLARKLSEHQYLWSSKSLASRLTGFFATRVMTSRMQHLSRADFVEPFSRQDFHGELYQLDEPVLDIQSVLEALRLPFQESIFQSSVKHIQHNQSRYLIQVNEHSAIDAKAIILTAGEGNEALIAELGFTRPGMQRRPLLMPMMSAPKSVLPKMYAHCLGASALPKMTITSHEMADRTVWYLGGEIAEKGVGRSQQEQVLAARQELNTLMPWMDFSQCQWSTLAIDRAEPKMSDGSRPAEPLVDRQENVITAWPVKLAMTPVMVDSILLELEKMALEKNSQAFDFKGSLQRAKTGKLPWETVQQWLQ
jgi:glycerol-3-phosphate dehydrogenase